MLPFLFRREMPMELLSISAANYFRAQNSSYPPSGRPAREIPPGYRQFQVTTCLHRKDFDEVVDELMNWVMHSRSGVRVLASAPTVHTGEVVVLKLGRGPFSINAPCRILETFDEPRRKGFTYCTLPGHPESGIETFLVEVGIDGNIYFTIVAISRAATISARMGGPFTRAVQRCMTQRYARALDRT